MLKHSRKKEWLKRYTLPEIAGLVGAYGSVIVYRAFSDAPSQIISSFIGTWGENLGYYSSVILKDLTHRKYLHTLESKFIRSWKVLRGVVVEFGLSETLDSFLVRPLSLYYGIEYFGEHLGILIGKLLADVVFYFPTIILYELRKKFNW